MLGDIPACETHAGDESRYDIFLLQNGTFEIRNLPSPSEPARAGLTGFCKLGFTLIFYQYAIPVRTGTGGPNGIWEGNRIANPCLTTGRLILKIAGLQIRQSGE